MSADQISELYATGSVKDLFKHSVYLSNDSNLHSWWRMGDDPDDAVDGTGVYGSSNRIKDVAKSGDQYSFPAANVSAFTTDVIGAPGFPSGSAVQNGKRALLLQHQPKIFSQQLIIAHLEFLPNDSGLLLP